VDTWHAQALQSDDVGPSAIYSNISTALSEEQLCLSASAAAAIISLGLLPHVLCWHISTCSWHKLQAQKIASVHWVFGDYYQTVFAQACLQVCVCVVLTACSARSMPCGFTRIKGLLKASFQTLNCLWFCVELAVPLQRVNVKYAAPRAGCYSTQWDNGTTTHAPEN